LSVYQSFNSFKEVKTVWRLPAKADIIQRAMVAQNACLVHNEKLRSGLGVVQRGRFQLTIEQYQWNTALVGNFSNQMIGLIGVWCNGNQYDALAPCCQARLQYIIYPFAYRTICRPKVKNRHCPVWLD